MEAGTKNSPDGLCWQVSCLSYLYLFITMFGRRGSSQQKKQQEQEHDEHQTESKVNELKAALRLLSGRNLLYCTDACLKLLEARNWNVDKAKRMLEETLTHGDQPISLKKSVGANFRDRFGRTVLIMKLGLQFLLFSAVLSVRTASSKAKDLLLEANVVAGQELSCLMCCSNAAGLVNLNLAMLYRLTRNIDVNLGLVM